PDVVGSAKSDRKIAQSRLGAGRLGAHGGRVPSRPFAPESIMNAITPIRPETPGLLTASAAYKPFRYPWAFDMWKKQQQVHWMPEEVPVGEDVKDWASKLDDGERNLLTQIFRFFTQADIEVQDNYMERYGRVFKPTEVKMMLAAFANMETIHIAAYALLLETIGMPDSEFGAFMEYEAMKDKHDYMGQFGVDSDADIC